MFTLMIKKYEQTVEQAQKADFLALLVIRLYLAPVFWLAGMNKLTDMPSVIAWFGNDDWGLGLPFPALMAWLAVLTELAGAVLLLLGLTVRLISISLIITMLVAIFMVHWPHGWQAVADPMSAFASSDVSEAIRRLDIAKDILKEHGNYEWLTAKGNLVVSNNGIEWAVTYLILCSVLLFNGGGRLVSLDYWIKRTTN